VDLFAQFLEQHPAGRVLQLTDLHRRRWLALAHFQGCPDDWARAVWLNEKPQADTGSAASESWFAPRG
jgi:hypothetical protein